MACKLKQVPLCLKSFCCSCFGSCLWEFSWYGLVFLYLNWETVCSKFYNHCFAWLFNKLKLPRISIEALCLILTFAFSFGIFCHMLFCWEMILDIYEIYHQEINPNTSCLWTIGIILSGRSCWSSSFWILLLFVLFLAKKVFCVDSRVFLASCGSFWFI